MEFQLSCFKILEDDAVKVLHSKTKKNSSTKYFVWMPLGPSEVLQ